MNEKKKTGKSTTRVLAGAGMLAVVAALYAGYWYYIAGQVRSGIAEWADMRRAEGGDVSYGSLTISGFPFRLVAEITEPKIAQFWSWKGPKLALSVRPWRLNRIKFRAPGLHQLTIRGEDYFIVADTLHGKVRFQQGRPVRIRLFVTDLVVRNGADEGVGEVKAADVEINRSGRLLKVRAYDLFGPREPIPGLGRKTQRLGIEAQATGDFPDLSLGIPVNGETMARWRDSGGTIEVRRLDIDHGPLKISGDGTLALDQAMQPIGSFTVKAQGHMEALDRLRDAGLIKANDHGLVRLVLTALTKEGALKVPLTIQDRRVYVGPVPLAKLPLVQWPQAPQARSQ